MALRLNYFDAGNIHYEGHWKGWALEMDFHPIKIITSRAIKTTGTLVVIPSAHLSNTKKFSLLRFLSAGETLTLSWKASFVKIYIVENKWFSLLETEMKCLLELRENINFQSEEGEHFLKLQYMYVYVVSLSKKDFCGLNS
jgi:hypothetical protein